MHDWPHSPAHRFSEAGTYMVTAGIYRKLPLFGVRGRLDFLCDALLELASIYGWQLQAWAVFPNHYHFVALSPVGAESLRKLIQHLHSVTARQVNGLDGTPSRKVWFEYWESRLTFQKSYLARLSYVHRNAVHHGLVRAPTEYPWCSAGWFQRKAKPAFYRVVMSFTGKGIKVRDDYSVELASLGME